MERLKWVRIVQLMAAFLISCLATNVFAHHSERAKLEALAETAAVRHGIPSELFKALVETESHWRPHVVGPTGAIGLAQIKPATARTFCGLSRKQLRDPQKNLNCGALYLARLINRFDSIKLGVCSYNAGESRVARLGRCPHITVTKRYTKKIMAAYRKSLAAKHAETSRLFTTYFNHLCSQVQILKDIEICPPPAS